MGRIICCGLGPGDPDLISVRADRASSSIGTGTEGGSAASVAGGSKMSIPRRAKRDKSWL